MPTRRNAPLPQKICSRCQRPFAWRKKWERIWDDVKYCSERCRRESRGTRRPDDLNVPRSAP
jgi:hypothetical protein